MSQLRMMIRTHFAVEKEKGDKLSKGVEFIHLLDFRLIFQMFRRNERAFPSRIGAFRKGMARKPHFVRAGDEKHRHERLIQQRGDHFRPFPYFMRHPEV